MSITAAIEKALQRQAEGVDTADTIRPATGEVDPSRLVGPWEDREGDEYFDRAPMDDADDSAASASGDATWGSWTVYSAINRAQIFDQGDTNSIEAAKALADSKLGPAGWIESTSDTAPPPPDGDAADLTAAYERGLREGDAAGYRRALDRLKAFATKEGEGTWCAPLQSAVTELEDGARRG